MKKLFSMLLVLAMAGSVLTGCGAKEEAPADTSAPSDTSAPAESAKGESLTFTTGGDQGTYYAFGNVLAGQVSGATSTAITAITSNGSAANIDNLEMNDAQLGFAQSDVMTYAYNGTALYADTGAVSDFSTVAALYMEQVQIVTCNPDIKTVADLAGKTVSIGASGSGVYFNALDILGAYGITEDDINATYEDFGNSAESLQDGKIDAAFVVAGAPTTAITSLATAKGVYLVSMDQEHIDALIESSPYYSANTIPADTYEGFSEDATTVAVAAVVIARDDASEQAIYDFVSTTFESIDEITKAHAKGGELDVDFASSFTAVPYHAGAAKYYAEKGIEVATK